MRILISICRIRSTFVPELGLQHVCGVCIRYFQSAYYCVSSLGLFGHGLGLSATATDAIHWFIYTYVGSASRLSQSCEHARVHTLAQPMIFNLEYYKLKGERGRHGMLSTKAFYLYANDTLAYTKSWRGTPAAHGAQLCEAKRRKCAL